MRQEDLNREWLELAPKWIAEMRYGRNAHRKGLLDSYMLAGCGDVNGLSVLDSGCGEGRFSRISASAGATKVVGVDLCETMIEAARELEHEAVQYICGDVQNLDFLTGDFDLAVSYLNQSDVPDFEANTRELFRLLKPQGKFVVSIVHPLRSSLGTWHYDEGGNRQHMMVDKYFCERSRPRTMFDLPLTNFHRTLSTYAQTYIKAGFIISNLEEPRVSVDSLKSYPELEDERRVPNFILFELTKP